MLNTLSHILPAAFSHYTNFRTVDCKDAESQWQRSESLVASHQVKPKKLNKTELRDNENSHQLPTKCVC